MRRRPRECGFLFALNVRMHAYMLLCLGRLLRRSRVGALLGKAAPLRKWGGRPKAAMVIRHRSGESDAW